MQYLYLFISLYDLYEGFATSSLPIPPAETARLRMLRRVGFAFLLAGSFLRIWAMQTLGRLFTFRIAVRKDHKVVRTGPFAIVR